jgi:predicted nucleic acid-binding protein
VGRIRRGATDSLITPGEIKPFSTALPSECWFLKTRQWSQQAPFGFRKVLDQSRIKVISAKNKAIAAKLRKDFNLGIGEAEAIALAMQGRALLLGTDDKSGINACKLLGISFTTAVDILVRSREKILIGRGEALVRLAALAKHGRYKNSIIEDVRRRLEEQP